ncbi:ARC6/PARC6 family protein [Oculatella sp. LEGE 06141]|uniref:ARC6/PARC6 family protein n=1 Tax=Oculatella sp. LEGE 06141 TaxID=1828648 RepID=UPI00188090EE|nr:ARC6/PARC6 family protein [Oculatella sp. LEGE 06141]MBE9181237.1 ARC6/PARC6 family protein [Oculatella sp. LEGE 06141]
MRLSFSRLLLGLGISISVGILPAHAQVTDAQVGALVEALRQAAPQTGNANDGLYSDWQIKPENIPRWSRSCTGRELTPAQFEANTTAARNILVCVMRDVLRDEYQASGNNEELAVRRAAAWWMTGDPTRYGSGDTATYTQRVLSFYRQPNAAAPAAASSATPATQNSLPVFDRYMRAGYAATQARDYETALLYFQRALDERPNDTYAQQALRNVESYQNRTNQPAPGASQPAQPNSSSSTGGEIQQAVLVSNSATLTQEQAVDLISQWLNAKQQIFAPPYNQQLAVQFTTGELYSALVNSNGVMAWLQNNQAYYRFGVQQIDSVERFAANDRRATIEVAVTEDRTLYERGRVNSTHTHFDTEVIRFTLEAIDGGWKIADYKTVEGSLLERSVIETASPET